jgi:hypothetical protein
MIFASFVIVFLLGLLWILMVQENRRSKFVDDNFDDAVNEFRYLGYSLSRCSSYSLFTYVTYTVRYWGNPKKGYREESDPLSVTEMYKLMKSLEETEPRAAREILWGVIGKKKEEKPQVVKPDWKIGGKL